jgi:mono/diheme cytochrome c family protein
MERTFIGAVERIRRRTQWVTATLPGALVFLASCSGGALAQSAAHPPSAPALSSGTRFVQTTGKDLFANICQGCHMPDGGGAVGAAMYPSLANNRKLEASGYPVYVVVNDLRTHFGNDYSDVVTAADVKVVRP